MLKTVNWDFPVGQEGLITDFTIGIGTVTGVYDTTLAASPSERSKLLNLPSNAISFIAVKANIQGGGSTVYSAEVSVDLSVPVPTNVTIS